MASREPLTLTSAEVHALAERLRSRTRRPSNLTDSLPPGRWYTWWPNCKPCVVRSSAPRRARPTWPTISANCFLIERHTIGAPSRSGLTDNASAGPASAPLSHQTIR